MTDRTQSTADRSAGDLLSDALSHMSSLVRKEMDLARAEMSESASRAAVAVGLLAGALVIALASLNVLAAALVVAIAEWGLDPAWASLLVGLALALCALVMVLKARNDLKLANIMPSRTARNVKRDAQTLTEVTRNDDA